MNIAGSPAAMFRLRLLRAAMLMFAVATGIRSASDIAGGRTTAETDAFDRIYYSALLSGRDPQAALRKAQFTADLLVKQFHMTGTEAAAEVAQFMIWRAGGLCGGG